MSVIHDSSCLSLSRQLSLLGSVLSGQTQFTIGQMRHTGRLQLFNHALGLIELLQPHVFGRQHSDSFNSVLDCFFSLMKVCEFISYFSCIKFLKAGGN